MERNLKEAIKHRRSIYSLGNKSPVDDDEIIRILRFALMHVPSAFNSQSTRMVLLLGEQHTRLWNIVRDTLRPMVSEEAFKQTQNKIDTSFASGYGTVLFYEDKQVIENLQENFSTYHEKFPLWSQQTSGMHQFAVWTMLEDAGFGASLQHYNPLIDKQVAIEWDIPFYWELIAQMPFGIPTGEPGEKTFNPLEERLKIMQ